MTHRKILRAAVVLVVLLGWGAANIFAQTTEFTYQGRLTDGALPANASYDFEFRLHAVETSGTELAVQSRFGVSVINGIFTTRLDFGANFDGTPRWLEIAVKPAGGGPFTTLNPRQPVSSAPYSIRSLNSMSADVATTANDTAQLGGIAANQYVQTTDPRMTNARNPLPFSQNYIQNTPFQQVGTSNFSISGAGTADAFNAQTEYRINGDRIFGIPGNNNTFAGLLAGAANTSGGFNTFLGRSAGNQNSTGSSNTFVGTSAGESNTMAPGNSFFGSSSGRFNTGGSNSFFGSNTGGANLGGGNNSFFGQSTGSGNTSGSDNTFLGTFAGSLNTTGFRNTIIGFGANVGANNLTNATAIGWNAVVNASNTMVLGTNSVTVSVPGDLGVIGTFNASGVQFSGLGAQIANLNVTGTLTGSGAGLLALSASNITTGTLSNARLGIVPIANGGTGSATRNFVDLTSTEFIGGNKSFSNAVNTSAQYNILGQSVLSTTGTNNVFAGFTAGALNTGVQNAFFGAGAGAVNTTGTSNSFFGSLAGDENTTGGTNSFFGRNAGGTNTTGDNNAFFGNNAGNSNTTGGSNTVIGFNADVGSGDLTSATAIGAGAVVTTSNTMVLGTNADTVNVPGTFNIGGGGQIARMRATTTSLNFPSVNQVEELDVSVPGAQLGDVVLLGMPANIHIVLVYSAYVRAANIVTVRAHHTTPTDPPVDPPSGVFRILVIGF